MARVRIHHLQAQATSELHALRLVRTVCREIQFRAKVTASTGPYTTGRLAQSINTEVIPVPTGVRGRVGSNLKYAASVQGGAGAHKIYPHRPPSALRFYWRKVGHVVYFYSVNHPGQPGKHYLTDSLKEIARRHRMRYIVFDY
jgi:hypothetical protein